MTTSPLPVRGPEVGSSVAALRADGYAIIRGSVFEEAIVGQLGVEAARAGLAELRDGFGGSPKDPYSPGNRRRSYAQVRLTGFDDFEFGIYEPYLQTAKYNPDTGGVVREYPLIEPALRENSVLRALVSADVGFVREYREIGDPSETMIGVHLFRYEAYPGDPAYSSPNWLHRDDEDVVFVHLVDRSRDAVGGDSVIAANAKQIELVHPLADVFDTLVTNHKKLHAVTPVGSASASVLSPAVRDIILVTFQRRAHAE
ncbi:MAG: 2OG-Fe dioxygenase family protein [Segniliparus sp.]|uniref:2OG-Fe dioxygenase family protein n=1 Tax=Segniliparus sp. TaxID=2804064 RepID=UPI003F3FC571